MIPLIALCLAAPLEFGLQPLPEDSPYREEGFTKFTEVIAPNGKPIPIIAQEGVRDIAVARSKNLLLFFLTDAPKTKYGSNKSTVANAMANNNAMLMMPEGEHQEGNEPEIHAQPLYESETPVDGSRWYIENDWNHRDAAFEEIFHLVHDTGIGTDFPGALPQFQKELKAEAIQSLADGRWGIPIDPHVKFWIKELAEENSLPQEYIASALDSYYVLWSSFDEEPGGMWGIYVAKNRTEMKEKDPKGLALLESFLPPMMHGYESLIDPTFTGTFSIEFDKELPYTQKSQYYVDVTLTGNKNTNIIGNSEDNTFRGNKGDNTIHGGKGNDTVLFTGKREEYAIEGTTVKDLIPNRDGTDTLHSIEVILFAQD